MRKVISQGTVQCTAEPDLGQMGWVGFEPGSFPPELETFVLHRMAFPWEVHPLSLGRGLVPAALPQAGPPNSHSWGLRASRLVFNKEDEFI